MHSTDRTTIVNAGVDAALDAWTRRLVVSLEQEGVRVIVLKGPRQTQWLHGNAFHAHHSTDIDLFVDPLQRATLGPALRARGFRLQPSSLHGDIDPSAPSEWRSTEIPFSIDLHSDLWGAEAPPEKVWEALKLQSGQENGITILSAPAMALHVVLHAAQHGPGDAKTERDLFQAISKLDLGQWLDVKRIATDIEALAALRAGLEMSPRGAQIALDLGLGTVQVPDYIRLRAAGARSEALAVLEVKRTNGTVARSRLVARKLVPPRAFMEYWYPDSGGRLTLLRAHASRWRRILRNAPAAIGELRDRKR